MTGKPASICYKHDALAFGAGIVEMERGGFAEIQAFTWQTDASYRTYSWGYSSWIINSEIIQTLIDEFNGNLLLNIGPKGTVRFRERSGYLKGNRSLAGGEMAQLIYDLCAWRQFEGLHFEPASGLFSDGDIVTLYSSRFPFTFSREWISFMHLQWSPLHDQWLAVEALADERENLSLVSTVL